jgi:hypothetical protein
VTKSLNEIEIDGPHRQIAKNIKYPKPKPLL